MKKLLIVAILVFPAMLYADTYQKVDSQTVMVTKNFNVADLQSQLKNVQAMKDREQGQHDLKQATYEAKETELKAQICTANNLLPECR